jgi:hypothetical protein
MVVLWLTVLEQKLVTLWFIFSVETMLPHCKSVDINLYELIVQTFIHSYGVLKKFCVLYLQL